MTRFRRRNGSGVAAFAAAHFRSVAGGDHSSVSAPTARVQRSRVGTLCVVDHRPRLLEPAQLDQLRELAQLVVTELESSSTGGPSAG